MTDVSVSRYCDRKCACSNVQPANDLALLSGEELGSIRDRVDVGERRTGTLTSKWDVSRRTCGRGREPLLGALRDLYNCQAVVSEGTDVPGKKSESLWRILNRHSSAIDKHADRSEVDSRPGNPEIMKRFNRNT